MIILGKLMDDLDFCKDFITALMPCVCGILVCKDRVSSGTKYESPVILVTVSIFQWSLSFVSYMTDGLSLLAKGNDNQNHIFCLCGNRRN